MRTNRTTIEKGSLRRAFTLIEILIVITIIALLIALLIPAINSVRTSVNIAGVRTEITALDQALNDFKAKYGVYPPSSITLHNGSSPANALSNWNNDLASKTKIQAIWSDFNFSQRIQFAGTSTDIWADGTVLEGPECLVFFLGGVPRTSTTSDLNGFSNDITNPFRTDGASRTGPFFEFDISRLASSALSANSSLSKQPLVYKDPLPGQSGAYLYASSYNGRGYRDADIGSYMTSAYGQTAGGKWKPKTHQIISPGYDGLHGLGGTYNPDNTATLGANDKDNITNFVSSTLDN